MNKLLVEIAKGMAALPGVCLMNYAGFILSKMLTNPELTVLKFHTTAVGDRAVLRWSGDPNHLYEVEIRAWRPSELEPESSTFMFPVKKT